MKGVSYSDVLLNWIFPENLTRYKKQRTDLLFNRQYRFSKYFTSHGDISSIKQTHSCAANWRDDVMITRLLCKMMITPAILFRFGLVDNDRYSSCQVTDSLEHFSFSCSKYRTQSSYCWDNSVLRSGFSYFIEFSHNFCKNQDFGISTLRFLNSIGRF